MACPHTHIPAKFKAAGQSCSKGASQTAKTQSPVSFCLCGLTSLTLTLTLGQGGETSLGPRLDLTDTNAGTDGGDHC